MYRKYIALFLVILLFLPGCTGSTLPGSSGKPQQESRAESEILQTQASSEPEETLSTLYGSISDLTEQTITVRSDSGHKYVFEKNDAVMQTGKDGAAIGCDAAISFYGTLSLTKSIQNVTVKKIVISGYPGQKITADEQAQHILSKMTMEEKIGQMFLARCPEKSAAKKAAEYKLGGYILFAKDFKDKTKEQAVADIKSYQDASILPMLIGVDEEGGTVNRISLYPQLRAAPFCSPQDLYAEGGWNRIISDTIEKAKLLKSLGVNLNLAPVCDVSTNPSDFIYQRSFGKDANQTAEYVRRVVETMNQYHMGCALKHFPGYGNNKDTHTGIAYDERGYETFESSDFLPFIAGMDAGAGMILVSHNVVKCMDPDFPASLSPKVHQILREKLSFDGVLMTDDLYMDAIRQYTGDKEAAVLAVLAGNDMLCCTDFETQIPAVTQAVDTGAISRQQIDASVLKILIWKIRLGIIVG